MAWLVLHGVGGVYLSGSSRVPGDGLWEDRASHSTDVLEIYVRARVLAASRN